VSVSVGFKMFHGGDHAAHECARDSASSVRQIASLIVSERHPCRKSPESGQEGSEGHATAPIGHLPPVERERPTSRVAPAAILRRERT
jgi:hypothetical protein